MTAEARNERPERRDAAATGRDGAYPMRGIALSMFAVGVAWLAIAPFVIPMPSSFVVFSVAVTAVAGVAALFARSGQDTLAALVVVGNCMAATWIAVVFSGGLDGPWAVTPAGAVVAAALAFGRNGALVATVISLVTAALVYTFEPGSGIQRWVPDAPAVGPFAQLSWFLIAAMFVGVATERQRAAVRRAKESEAESRRLFDQASDAIFVLAPDGRYLDGNDSACALAGRTREQLRLLRPRDILEIDPDDLREDSELLETQQVIVRERTIVRPDGRKRICESSARRLSDGRIEAIVRDVTERREAERMTRRLGQALDDLSEGILVFDTDERLVYANRAFAEFRSAPIDWSDPPRAEDLVSTPRSKAGIALLRQALAEGRRWTERFEIDRGGGGYAVLDASFSPVRGPRDEPMGIVGVVRDVTRELELETKLRQAEKLEALGRLAGGVAHDFNNILTAVLGLAEFQSRKLGGESEAATAAHEIRAAALQGRDLTRQLLTFGRKQPVQPQVLDLNRVVSDTAVMLRRVIREDVELILGLEHGLPAVEADPTQLRQVLLNLATNARDAMPSGGVLRIATRSQVDERGRWVALSVQDDGEGMDEDTRARIFEPFFTTKPAGQGTGLGLPSVHGIVEQSGGRIDVTSRLGAGTTIHIALPAIDGAPPEATDKPPEPSLASGSFTLLVIEDQEPLRRLIARLLRDAGHRVFEASEGRQALAMVDDLPPLDLVVTDIVMPGLDGPAIAARLRERDPALRVLFTSGHAADLAGPVAREGAGFVAKPFTAQELLMAVQETLRGAA